MYQGQLIETSGVSAALNEDVTLGRIASVTSDKYTATSEYRSKIGIG